MENLDEKLNKINQESEQWEKEKEYLTKKDQIEQQKAQFQNKKKFSTSKLLTFFLFINCTAIEIFTCVIIVININIAREQMVSPDLSPLISLIGAVIGETISFAIYSVKAAKQNCKGGIVYEQALIQANRDNHYYNIQEDLTDYGKNY